MLRWFLAAGVIGHHLPEGCQERIGIGGAEDQRRTHLDDVVVRAGAPGEEALVLERVDDLGGTFPIGRLGRRILDQVDPDEQAVAAYVTPWPGIGAEFSGAPRSDARRRS